MGGLGAYIYLLLAWAATVTAQAAVYVTPSTVIEAVTVQVPALTAVTVPLLTVAIAVSLDFHVTVDPTGLTVAEILPVAPPTVSDNVDLSRVIVGIAPVPRT